MAKKYEEPRGIKRWWHRRLWALVTWAVKQIRVLEEDDDQLAESLSDLAYAKETRQ